MALEMSCLDLLNYNIIDNLHFHGISPVTSFARNLLHIGSDAEEDNDLFQNNKGAIRRDYLYFHG